MLTAAQVVCPAVLWMDILSSYQVTLLSYLVMLPQVM